MVTIARVTPVSVSYPEPNDNDVVRNLTLCRIETSDGVVGWGEAVAMWPEACRATEAVINGMADLVVGRDPRQVESISHELAKRSWWYGTEGIASFARSAIDIALWDVKGKVVGEALVDMLGGAVQDVIPAIASTHAFLPSLEEEVHRHASYVAGGFFGVKVGLGKAGQARLGYDFQRDVAFVRLLREAIGPDADIMLDRGQHLRWDSAYAIRLVQELAKYRLRWMEEPLEPDDAIGFRHYRNHCSSLLATGERCWNVRQYRALMESDIVDVVGCDPARVGGITTSREVIRLVEEHYLWFNAHAWSSAITSAASLALAASTSRAVVFELKPIPNPMQNELVREPIWHDGGLIRPLSGPGLGIEVNEDVVEKYRMS